MSKDVSVRMRLEYQTLAIPLFDVPFEKFNGDDVIELLKRWGVESDEEYSPEMYGQWRLTNTEAFFEVVLTE